MDADPMLKTVSRDSLVYEDYDPGQVAWLRRDSDDHGDLWCGFWRVDPSEMPPGALHQSAHDESFLLIEGRARLEFSDGTTVVLSAGDAASITKGAAVRWTILEPMVEFFVYT